MPLPFILLGAAAAAAAAGIGTGVKGAIDSKDATDVNNRAKNIVDIAHNKLDISRKATHSALENFGREKIYVLDNSVRRFIEAFEKLKNVDLESSSGLDEVNKLKFDKASFEDLKKCSLEVASMLAGGFGGIG